MPYKILSAITSIFMDEHIKVFAQLPRGKPSIQISFPRICGGLLKYEAWGREHHAARRQVG